MTTAHTATPWQVNDRDPDQICDADGEIRGCAPIALMVGKAAEKRANAKFIVRACNAHDDLVKSVEWLLDCMRIAGWEGDQAAIFARAALAKAGEA